MLPILDEIRRVRHEMSAEIGHNPRKIVDYYAELSARYSDRIVSYGSVQEKNRIKDGNGNAGRAVSDVGPTAAPTE